MRLLLCLAALAASIAACHEPEAPPVPPKPTNPTNVRPAVALEGTGEVLDASIVSEAKAPFDAGVFSLEATPVVGR
jgi:hypothetical protein